MARESVYLMLRVKQARWAKVVIRVMRWCPAAFDNRAGDLACRLIAQHGIRVTARDLR